ncbi:alpha-(1,3)-fucosyltransferase C [Manduca sexta]|nr:alpha-(1,3)-fucosyltransferase C [Manduca sexta]
MYLFSKTEILARLFFIISFTGLVMYVILAFYSFHTAYSTVTEIGKFQTKLKEIPHPDLFKAKRFDNDLKYILLWVQSNIENPIGEGQKPFIENNCTYINCFLTTNKDVLNADYRNFDAIIFNMSLLPNWRKLNMPQTRTMKQKYIFHSMLPSNDNPICNINLDSHFNWTWSYKLYSDIVTPFIEVKDLNGNVIAPNIDVEWPILETKFEDIRPKSKAVVFVMGKCHPRLRGMSYAKDLQHYLKEHKLVLDIYGCGGIKCSHEDCKKDVGRNYYFYLVSEESGSEDYVTKDVMHAFNSEAVPIMMGGSDFSRFFPDGSYIDSRGIFPEKLAAILDYLIRNPEVYNAYHQWRANYTIQPVNMLRGLCDLCELLNDVKRVNIQSYYETFRKWWYYGALYERCYPKGAESFSEVLSYINVTKSKKIKKI